MIAVILCALFLTTVAGVDQNNGRILDGLKATAGQFPYHVGIGQKIPKTNRINQCGGSLISNNWILTAGHCVDLNSPVDVYLGSINIFRGVKKFRVERKDITIHPEFTGRSYDIALIKIPPVSFTRQIKPIELATESTKLTGNEIGTITGWGITNRKNETSDVLLFSHTKVLKVNGYPDLIKGASTCSGDSGGPLTINGANGKLIQIGVHNFKTVADCSPGNPSYFSRVTYYLPWIRKVTKLQF